VEVKPTATMTQPGFPRRLAIVVALLLIAFGMRTYQLAEVPAGMMHDELLQLRAAAEVSRGEWKMLYNPGYGSEPLYYPVLSASQSLLGTNPLGRRLPGVFAGLLGLCLVYVLAYRLLGWRIAVIALGASAVVWWSVVMQRIILREVLEMPLYALALYMFWRGYEEATRTPRHGWRFFIVAGVALGTAQYVHTIPRGLFVVFVLFGLYLLVFHRSSFRRMWRGILVLVIIAEALAAPLLTYADQHPDVDGVPTVDLFQENGVATFTGRLPATVARIVGQFFYAGDDAGEYNIPYRPIFEPLGALLFGLGLLVALWRIRRPVYAFLLIAWAIVLVPNILYDTDLLFSRLVSAQATTYIFLGIGVETIADGLQRIRKGRFPRAVIDAGLLGLGVVYLLGTAHDMFVVWPSLNNIRWVFNTSLRDLGRYFDAQTQPLPPISECTLFVWPDYHDSLAQLGAPYLIQRRDVQPRWHDCRYSMVIPAGAQYLYVYPGVEPLSDFLGRAVQKPWLDTPSVQPAEGLNNALRVDVRAPLAEKLAQWSKLTVAWPPEAQPSASAQLPVDFNHAVELIGYQIKPQPVKPGGSVRVITYWRVTGNLPADVMAFTHLYRTPSEIMAQQDQLDVVGPSLQPGDVFMQSHEFLTVPPDTPAGAYWIGVGLYRKDTGERWPIYAGDQHTADRIFLTQVQVTP
jgi:4-amino-4-deoxy-L-arabinose transferase-like glycosyltransferase